MLGFDWAVPRLSAMVMIICCIQPLTLDARYAYETHEGSRSKAWTELEPDVVQPGL